MEVDEVKREQEAKLAMKQFRGHGLYKQRSWRVSCPVSATGFCPL